MTKKGLLIALGIDPLTLPPDSGAAPIRPVGPVDVAGTIGRIQWVPETSVKGRPGWSGSLGYDRTMPAHFLLTLTDYEGVDAETAHMITRYLDGTALEDNEQKGSADEEHGVVSRTQPNAQL